ncbi:uncharacterized protein PHACADRAFT_201744 [Phanerochaete carnosa HHB-10118-sp]|uniref:Uncharacterized protein n=1 Tax=Phanerochaete carnosa (strain HHB-10118-sp) TaxID=650164 RepID=K5WGQ4_PHACS|nr:uncharacterized protein PHACADRAFT_201744 [Phanerochaete carnosa HHB-10118-sp]EKM49357.1 hypothetical protein PHACADRAFT_201744 [Phanerochaete carnosa HHB-10118-sp]
MTPSADFAEGRPITSRIVIMPITHPSDGFGFGTRCPWYCPSPGSHGASLRSSSQNSDLRLLVSPQQYHLASLRSARLPQP